MPILDQSLLDAYQATHYWVDIQPPVCLQIDTQSLGFVEHQKAHGVQCSTWITAHNPESEPLSVHENVLAHRGLTTALSEAGWGWVGAWSDDPKGQWPREDGVLVWGMPPAIAKIWALRWRQHAVVCVNATGWVKLIAVT